MCNFSCGLNDCNSYATSAAGVKFGCHRDAFGYSQNRNRLVTQGMMK